MSDQDSSIAAPHPLAWPLRVGALAGLEWFALWLVIAAISRGFSYQTSGLDWDESLYVVMAQRWLHGDLPFVAVWDQHPAGLPALIAAAEYLTGATVLAARLAALVAVAATATLIHLFCRRHARNLLAGGIAGLLYVVYMARPDGLSANVELFDNLAVVSAAFLLVGAVPARGGRLAALPFLAGAVLLGIGLQLKYVVIPEAVLLCCTALALAWQDGARWPRLAGLAGLGIVAGLLPTALVTAYFWHAGALGPYLDANLRANAAYVGLPIDPATVAMRLRYGLLPLICLLPFFALPVLALRPGRLAAVLPRRLAWWMLVWLVAVCIDIALPMKFWKHYFNALLPPLCILAGLWLSRLRRRGRQAVALAVLLAPALALMLRHAGVSRDWNRADVAQEVAARICRDGAADDVYVFNNDPAIYAYAHARPPTPYVLGIELADFADSSGVRATAEVARILDGRPRWIVLGEPTPYRFNPRILALMEATLRRYHLVGTWDSRDYVQPHLRTLLFRRDD